MGTRFPYTSLSPFLYHFVLVSKYYFTKWTEDAPLKNMIHMEVIDFITKHIICRLNVPQTLSTYQGTSFVSNEVEDFFESYKIKFLNSPPYYAQSDGKLNQEIKL